MIKLITTYVSRINGIANGVSTVVRECILDRFAQSNNTMSPSTRKEDKLGTFDLKHFEARFEECFSSKCKLPFYFG